MDFSSEVVAVLTALGRKKLALLSKRIFNRIAAPLAVDSRLFSEEERAKLVASFGVSSLEEVDRVVNSLDSFWQKAVAERATEQDILTRLRSLDFNTETRTTMTQIWSELGAVLLDQEAVSPKKPVAVPTNVPDLLDVDYSVGIVVASKNTDESLPKPVMLMDLLTTHGHLNAELDFNQLAALHYALRDAQVHLDSS
ncbi:hypothetical protein QR680_005312 [Steinernema hermaphroditum]|uniref:COMM domain-containing protein n=1 Tax=Steinernema hermaphroditum TaxID=289476 RepID=A0AA39HST1_9BILA|nr:hypothetical protein QR680_005312 [Steinernema hermaphroditum]